MRIIAVTSVVRRVVVFATPPAHTVLCCKCSLALAVCTVAMFGQATGSRGGGLRSSLDASPAAVAAGEAVACDPSRARAAVAARAEPDDEPFGKRQFTIVVPVDYLDRGFLETLPWQSIAVVNFEQAPGTPPIVRCIEGGDDYKAFFDYTMLECPGTRPTVVGRDGVVEDGFVVNVVERLADDDEQDAAFVFHCAIVQLCFGRTFAGMSGCRLAVAAFSRTISCADAVRIAVAILAAAPDLIIFTYGGEVHHPMWIFGYVVESAFKMYGAAFFWHYVTAEIVVCSVEPWDGSTHYDATAEEAYQKMALWAEADRSPEELPNVSEDVVTTSAWHGCCLPRPKPKNLKGVAVAVWFGNGTRTEAAKHARKLREDGHRKRGGKAGGGGRGRGRVRRG